MNPVIERYLLTEAILAALQRDDEVEQWLVGDHEKPLGGAWTGEAGRSTFIPYVVLTSLPSQPPTGAIRGSEQDVNFPYALTSMGDSRVMAERMSDIARGKVAPLFRTKLQDGRTIGQVRTTRYGGVDRLSREPPLYSITDQVLFWTTS